MIKYGTEQARRQSIHLTKDLFEKTFLYGDAMEELLPFDLIDIQNLCKSVYEKAEEILEQERNTVNQEDQESEEEKGVG